MARLGDLSLGYCTNVHAGESWREIEENLRTHAARIKKLAKRDTLALGLWLPEQAARELHVSHLKQLCEEEGFTIPSINGFPIGGFHASQVKTAAYRPDWTQPERVAYTQDLLRVAERLCAPGAELSISTLPVSYREWIREPAQLEIAARQLAETALELARIEERSGARIHLALEPEPDCWLESSADVVRFFDEYLFTARDSRTQDLLRDKIRVCYDACHAALAFEEPEEALSLYEQNQIKIGKVQLSSALKVSCLEGETPDGASIVELLEPFAQDRYLHQVVGRQDRYADLPDALAAWRSDPPTDEFRIHCHVPLFMETHGSLGTTQDHVVKLLELAQSRPVASHWEVETYTWDVLPTELRKGDLSTRIAREITWI